MRARPTIRALVIDDSAYSRQTITRMLAASPLVEVVATARDGEDALRKTLELRPDVVTLDLEMPRMDGFTYLRLVMAQCPTPVIVVSGRGGDADVFKALDLGATAHKMGRLRQRLKGRLGWRNGHGRRDRAASTAGQRPDSTGQNLIVERIGLRRRRYPQFVHEHLG